MYDVTSKYLDSLRESTKDDRIEIKLTLKNGSTILLTDEDIVKHSLYISNQCLNSSEFQFGCTYAAECSFSFFDSSDRYKLFDAKVEITYYRKFSDGTEEAIPMGVYLIDEAEKTRTITTVKALDYMTLLDKTVDTQTVGTAFELLTFLAERGGFELAQTQEEIEALPNGAEMFSFYPDRIGTWRDALGYLAAMLCCFAVFGRNGKLKLCLFQTEENWSIPDDFRYKSKFNDAETYYQGVEVRFLANQNFYPYYHVDEVENGGLILDMGDIPIVQGIPETKELMLTNIYNTLLNIKYRPCEVEYFGNPAIDLGDCISFSEGKSIVTHLMWHYRGKQSIKSVGLNPKLQAVKDKTYKQLINMEADVEGCKIGIYTYVNATKFTIHDEAKKVINMQYSSVTDEKVLFLSSIQVDMDCDGEIEITFWVNLFEAPERTRHMYLTKGRHLLTLFDWIEVAENTRNEFWVFFQPAYVESDIRKHNAEFETEKLKFSALLEAFQNQTEYVEPEPVPIDTTIPTITIKEREAKGMVFGQGLAVGGVQWDGTLTFEEWVGDLTYNDFSSIMTFGGMTEHLEMSTQIPVGGTFTENIPVLTYENNIEDFTMPIITEELTVNDKRVSTTITTGTISEYNPWFVDTTENKFRPQTLYKYTSVEVDSDRGLRAELTVDTTGIIVTGLEVTEK